MPDLAQKLVLVAVLDWGLGHAGRIIPVVREIQQQGGQVLLASSGRAGLLLRQECPDLPYLECPAYHVHYRGQHMYWNIFRQLPKIFSAVLREHFWLAKLVREKKIDAVISDSRFGCFHRAIPSIILTHQLNLPLSPAWFSKIVNWGYRRLLNRFDAVWVPDEPDGLSGQLSYPSPFSSTHYIGCLSRLQPLDRPLVYDLLVLLSGPEPQRGILENLVLQQIATLPNLSVLIVQGKTEHLMQTDLAGTRHKIISYLSGQSLNEAMASARVVLCRSGYSSLMDLARLGKKSILVPTPGQPEQEFLADRCREKSWALVCSQEDLDLEEALLAVRELPGGFFPKRQFDSDSFSMVVGAFMEHR